MSYDKECLGSRVQVLRVSGLGACVSALGFRVLALGVEGSREKPSVEGLQVVNR